MKVYIGSDHAGFELKGKLISFLNSLGHEVIDKRAYEFNEGDDYPDFIKEVAYDVAEENGQSKGVIIGGSGQGEAMAANRIFGVRAAVLYRYDEKIITLSREHNDANILSLGARFLSEDEAKKAVSLWLETPFSGEERHVRRIAKLDN